MRALLLLTTFPCLGLAEKHPDVLMIAVDDLRPMLGCYGDPHVKTPNIDQLASKGVLFEKAYCQFAKCGPSRLSILTGMRPDQVGVTSHRKGELEEFREKRGHLPTLPKHFKQSGYHVRGLGKIHHDGWDSDDQWSVPPHPGRDGEMLEIVDEKAIADVPFPKRADIPTVIASRHDCPAIQSPDVPDETLFAGRMTTKALEILSQPREEPLLLAVGYRRPHLPFVAPKRYFDLYQPSPDWLPKHRQPAAHAPIMSWFNSDGYVGMLPKFDLDVPYPPKTAADALRWNGFELRSYNGMIKDGPIPDSEQLRIRHAYMACVSYVDSQIGRLLERLTEEDRWDKTVVILWSDHGWHLGEHGAWSKMTNYEIATRVPLIIASPNLATRGAQTQSIAELVDVYPTLCQLTNLQCPDHCEGESLVPVLEDPQTAIKPFARSQFPRFKTFDGRAIRTETHRYIEWTSTAADKVVARELYDHRLDPFETQNAAHDNPSTVERLQELNHSQP